MDINEHLEEILKKKSFTSKVYFECLEMKIIDSKKANANWKYCPQNTAGLLTEEFFIEQICSMNLK